MMSTTGLIFSVYLIGMNAISINKLHTLFHYCSNKINVVYVPVAIKMSISASYWQDKLVGVILSHQRVGSAI